MGKRGIADVINGSVGSIINSFLLSTGFMIGASLYLFAHIHPVVAVLCTFVISFICPVALHTKFPSLYLTSGEKDEQFQKTRRFGKAKQK